MSQTNQIVFGLTPNITSTPKVLNPSPAKIYGDRKINFQTQLMYNYISKSKLGLLVGIDVGIFNWNTVVEAPRNAFGTHRGTGNVDFTIYSDNFFYTGLIGGTTYSGRIKRLKYKVELGSAFRLYPKEVEDDVTGAAFNRDTPYDPDDPNSGPPDLLIKIPPAAKKIHPNTFVSINFPIKISAKSHLLIGLTNNWNLYPIGDGNMTVQYNDTFYKGKFSPRTSYFGVNLRYGLNLNRTIIKDRT